MCAGMKKPAAQKQSEKKAKEDAKANPKADVKVHFRIFLWIKSTCSPNDITIFIICCYQLRFTIIHRSSLMPKNENAMQRLWNWSNKPNNDLCIPGLPTDVCRESGNPHNKDWLSQFLKFVCNFRSWKFRPRKFVVKI